MFSKNVIIDLPKKDDIVHHEFVTDFHMGNSNWQEHLALKRRKAIANDPLRFMSFGGDQLDLILAGDPRFRDQAVRIGTRGAQMDAFDEFWDELFQQQIRYLDGKDKNEKIWYEQWGNHEWNSRVMDEDSFRRWTLTHGTDYMGSKAFIGVDIRHKGKTLMKKTMFVNHGAGGGNPEKALHDLTVNVEADIYEMGHLHVPLGFKEDILYMDQKTNHWGTKEQILINGGCFTTAVRDGTSQWMEEKGNKLKVSKPGTMTVSFNAYQNSLNYHG